METFNKCIEILNNSKSDNERLASLLVISKVTPNLEVNKEMTDKLYKAVSSKFLCRLLKSSTESDENTIMFKQLAVSIMSIISKIDSVCIVEDRALLDGLVSNLREYNERNATLYTDILELLLGLFKKNPTACTYLCQQKDFYQAVSQCMVSSDCYEAIEQLMFISLESCFQNNDEQAYLAFLDEKTQTMKCTQELDKFKELDVVLIYFRIMHKLEISLETTPEKQPQLNILQNTLTSINHILKSRVKSPYKESALCTLYYVFGIFGTDWVMNPTLSGQTVDEFLLLLLISSQITVYFALEQTLDKMRHVKENTNGSTNFTDGAIEDTEEFGEKIQEITEEPEPTSEKTCDSTSSERTTQDAKGGKSHQNDITLNACFSILKILLATICSDDFEQNELLGNNSDFIVKVFNCFKSTMLSVYTFLHNISDEQLDHPAVLDSLMMVAVWATEETENLQEELRASIPILLKAAEKYLNGKSDDVIMNYFVVLLPCVGQLLPDKTMRKILIETKCLCVLQKYGSYLFTSQTPTVIIEKHQGSLECLIHVFHEFFILEGKHSSSDVWPVDLLTGLFKLLQDSLDDVPLLSMYSSCELLVIIFRLSQINQTDKHNQTTMTLLVPKTLDYLSELINDVMEYETSLDEIWFIAMQSVIEFLSRGQITKNCVDTLKKFDIAAKFPKEKCANKEMEKLIDQLKTTVLGS